MEDNSKVGNLWSNLLSNASKYKQKLTIAASVKAKKSKRVVKGNEDNANTDEDRSKQIRHNFDEIIKEIYVIESRKCIPFKNTKDLRQPLTENLRL